MVISVAFFSELILESKEIKNSFSRPLSLSRILCFAEMTNGRAFRLCGAMGVKAKLSVSGMMIGPPQLKE